MQGDLEIAVQSAKDATRSSKLMRQNFAKAVVMMGSASESKISFDDASNEARIQELNQTMLEMDSYLVQYFENAQHVETMLSGLSESIDRKVADNEPFITDISSPLHESDDVKKQILQLQREITSMDALIDENEATIVRQANTLQSALEYVKKIHTFNDEFNNALLTLTPIKKPENED